MCICGRCVCEDDTGCGHVCQPTDQWTIIYGETADLVLRSSLSVGVSGTQSVPGFEAFQQNGPVMSLGLILLSNRNGSIIRHFRVFVLS